MLLCLDTPRLPPHHGPKNDAFKPSHRFASPIVCNGQSPSAVTSQRPVQQVHRSQDAAGQAKSCQFWQKTGCLAFFESLRSGATRSQPQANRQPGKARQHRKDSGKAARSYPWPDKPSLAHAMRRRARTHTLPDSTTAFHTQTCQSAYHIPSLVSGCG